MVELYYLKTLKINFFPEEIFTNYAYMVYNILFICFILFNCKLSITGVSVDCWLEPPMATQMLYKYTK